MCNSYRSINLLESVGNVIEKFLLKKLKIISICRLDISEIQSDFRVSSGKMDIIFLVRQLQEKCNEQ